MEFSVTQLTGVSILNVSFGLLHWWVLIPFFGIRVNVTHCLTKPLSQQILFTSVTLDIEAFIGCYNIQKLWTPFNIKQCLSVFNVFAWNCTSYVIKYSTTCSILLVFGNQKPMMQYNSYSTACHRTYSRSTTISLCGLKDLDRTCSMLSCLLSIYTSFHILWPKK